MKILHVAPHLGGGVGKAHSAISGPLRGKVEQTFALLEEPLDQKYTDAIALNGCRIHAGAGAGEIADLARSADIVQFEYWNHPRLFECLATCAFPAMRSVFWSHISGLSIPLIQPGFILQAGRFVFTSSASLAALYLAELPEMTDEKVTVIESGFGFSELLSTAPLSNAMPTITYLGTVDFVKMNPVFFDAIDLLQGDGFQVSVWGKYEPGGAVAGRANEMQHPDRIQFKGYTDHPESALRSSDIFFYPLQAHHYGTSENALIEAMSLGLVPVVLNNPAESAVVKHGETGFICTDISECVNVLQNLLDSRELRETVGENARRFTATNRTPERAAQRFVDLWTSLATEQPKAHDFSKIIGRSPKEWFLATQCLPGEPWSPPEPGSDQNLISKGTLAHFMNTFPEASFEPWLNA